MGVARKWHFSTSSGAANLGGASGDLSEHRGSEILSLGITSLFMHKLTTTLTVIFFSIDGIPEKTFSSFPLYLHNLNSNYD